MIPLTRRSLSSLSLLLVVACGKAPSAPNNEPAAPASLAPSPAPVAASSAPVKLEVPPGADADQIALLGSVCALAWRADEHGKVSIGCTSHPPFVEPAQRPTGSVARFTGDPMDLCTVAAVYGGSFSRPGAAEAIVAFDECHDDGDSFRAGSFASRSLVLLERVDGRWMATAYEESKDASDCRMYATPNERDGIVCRSGFAAPRLGEITYLYTIDFGKKEGGRVETFARFYDDLFDCAQYEESRWQLGSGFVRLTTDHFAVSSGAVQIDVSRARAAPAATLGAKVRAECKKRPESDGAALAGRPTTTHLTFPQRGRSFAPDPAAAKQLELWTRESARVAAEMDGAAPR